MGQQNSRILTKNIQPQLLIRREPVQVGLFFYPFKQFSHYSYNQDTQQVVLQLTSPYQDRIKLFTKYYDEIQEAVCERTFDIEIDQVLFDPFNFDRMIYRGWDNETSISFVQRKFKQFESQDYKNILYEKHIYETINSFQCPQIIKFQDSFCINTCLEEEVPLTYFFVFESLDANLSDIIRYRRQNNCEWYVTEFQKLCWDLVCAVKQLHQNNITHNDIRPFNVHYSIQKECYVLGQFSNTLKTDPNGTCLNIKTRRHPSFVISEKQLQDFAHKQTLTNHKRADIYALGMTLLCAFYMTEPIQRKFAAPINRKMEEQYAIMQVLRKMIVKSQQPLTIGDIKNELQNCNKRSSMGGLIESIKFRHKPKAKKLPMILRSHASAYKRLGLWQKWRDSLQASWQASDCHITPIEEADYCIQLARVQKLLQNHENADSMGEKAANLYYETGSKYLEENSFIEAYNTFSNGIKSLSFCINENKIVLVKLLQGLSILHLEKDQVPESLSCLNQSKRILKKAPSESILDYYQIKNQQALIHQLHAEYQEAELVLEDLLKEVNSRKDQFRIIQFLKKLGLNSLKKAQYGHKRILKQLSTDLRISESLQKSQSSKLFYQNNKQNENLQSNDFQKEKYQKAENYFQEALKIIRQKQDTLRKSVNIKEYEIELQNISILHIQIFKQLGDIKFKQGLIERAEDYFFKIIAEIDKLTLQNRYQKQSSIQMLSPKISQNNNFPSKTLQHFQQNLRPVIQNKNFNFAQKSDVKNKSRLTKNHEQRTAVTSKMSKRISNREDLLKMKADVQCSIGLCKQQQREYKQMLNYLNKSLSSYKSYYGQYHNKLCGVIIGSMAIGYQKTNQHSKALSCIQLASQILKDVQSINSPNLKHFQRVRLQVIEEEHFLEKKIESDTEFAKHTMTDNLSSTIGLRNRLKKQTSLMSNNSYGQNYSLLDSSLKFAEISEEQVEAHQISQDKQIEMDRMSESNSLKQVQMPLKVTYVNSRLIQQQNLVNE